MTCSAHPISQSIGRFYCLIVFWAAFSSRVLAIDNEKEVMLRRELPGGQIIEVLKQREQNVEKVADTLRWIPIPPQKKKTAPISGTDGLPPNSPFPGGLTDSAGPGWATIGGPGWKGEADVYTIRLRRMGHTDTKIVRRYNDFIFFPVSYGGADDIPTFLPHFNFFDVALHEDRLFVLLAQHRVMALEILDLKQPKKSVHIQLFDEETEPGLGSVERAQIIPVNDGAYIFFVSKEGKHALWEVQKDVAKMVWIKPEKLAPEQDDLKPPKPPPPSPTEKEY